MKRTDVNPIQYPKGVSLQDRRLIRRIVQAVGESVKYQSSLVLCCSGGLDSTVMAHAVSIAINTFGLLMKTTAVYVDHGLRPAHELQAESLHVRRLQENWLSDITDTVHINVGHEAGLQARAR